MKILTPLNRKHQIIVISLIMLFLASMIALFIYNESHPLTETDPLTWVLLGLLFGSLILSIVLIPVFFQLEKKARAAKLKALDSPDGFNMEFCTISNCIVVENGSITFHAINLVFSKDGITLKGRKGSSMQLDFSTFKFCSLTIMEVDTFLLSPAEINFDDIDNFTGVAIMKTEEVEKCLRLFSGLEIDDSEYRVLEEKNNKELEAENATLFTYKKNRTGLLLKVLAIMGLFGLGVGLGVFLILVCKLNENTASGIAIVVTLFMLFPFLGKYNFKTTAPRYVITKNHVAYNNALNYFSVSWVFVKSMIVTKNKLILKCEAPTPQGILAHTFFMKRENIVLARIQLMQAEHGLGFEIVMQDGNAEQNENAEKLS